MTSEVRFAVRFLVVLLLMYISTFAFDFLNMADSFMVAMGFIILVGEGMFVMWWVRSWFTKLVDESPVVVNPPSEPDNTKKEV
jgi:hypothetical protein